MLGRFRKPGKVCGIFVIVITKNLVGGYAFNLCENSISIVILGRIVIVRSTKQSVGIKVGAFDPDIIES